MSKLDEIAHNLRFAGRQLAKLYARPDQTFVKNDINRCLSDQAMLRVQLFREAMQPQEDVEIIHTVKQAITNIPSGVTCTPDAAQTIVKYVPRLLEIIEKKAPEESKEPPKFMGLEPDSSIRTNMHRCTTVHQPSVSQCIRQQNAHGSKQDKHQAWTSQGHYVEWAA